MPRAAATKDYIATLGCRDTGTNGRAGKEGMGLVMEPISVESAIEKAKKKGLKPGRVKGTNGIQFTKGRNARLEVITWDQFRDVLAKRRLQVFESGGWMKIMKRSR